MRLSRPTLTGSLLGALFCGAPLGSPAAPPAPVTKPVLVVFLTVDQMREDYFDRWKGQLTGGLKRFRDGAAFFTNGHQDHAVTETAPGHASIGSGRFPRSTGITRNLAGVNDPNSPLIGSAGPGASPFRFRGTTLTDWLTAADPMTRALSVSYKDRGAILPIGRSKQQVYWYGGRGTFTTSRWYRDSLPDWVNAFNARRLPASYGGKSWDLLLPASEYAEPDSVPVEASGRGFMFPHVLPANGDTAAMLLPNYPFIDEVTADLALAGVTALNLGGGSSTDVLAVSFSATDLVGHRYGPDSREVHDQILRLDRVMGRFIDSLYRLRDSTKIIFAMTGDHGVQPFPELNNGRIAPAPGRIDTRPAFLAAQTVILAAGGNPNAMDFESGAFLVERDSLKVKAGVLRTATDSFVAVARRIPGVLRADRFADLAKADLGQDYIARRWVQMFPADVPVEAVITLTEGSYWSTYPVAQHGTPHMQDSHVPILFYGPPFKTGRFPEFVRTVDMAPTLAKALGIRPTEPLDGRVLAGAIR
ncbi:MAG TPA: alkaline phosphatase family protein [Gemmatimonadales bacterium]|nr:alkaline phosphatase family protein [Gemmatimonadales bacterium]